MQKLLTRKTKIPLWLVLIGYLVAGGLIVLIFVLRQPTPEPASAAPATTCSTYTWTIHDVIEASPKAGQGRITWQRGAKLFQHDFPTQKGIGEKVLLELVFDCQAADGSPEVVPGCICKRLSTTDLMEANP